MNTSNNIHFIGIGGIGMSALARLARAEGRQVSGSDRLDSAMLEELRRLGISAFAGHRAENVPADALVVYSDAVRPDNPEYAVALSRKQTLLRRSQYLGELMKGYTGIAIAGTHGKTTTTAMTARIFLHAGLDPCVVVGGEALGPDRNARHGSGRHFIAEACEAYESFMDLHYSVAVVNNIEADHLDHHGTIDHLLGAFERFIDGIEDEGCLVYGADCPLTARIAGRFAGKRKSFGLRDGDYRAGNVTPDGSSTRFTVRLRDQDWGEVVLRAPGLHNVYNALAAIAIAETACIEPAEIIAGLALYDGVGRRFERIGERNGVLVYDDYAHHPTEVRAALQGARQAFPENRIVAQFQPHLYSRTRDFLAEFAASFDEADVVLITDIFGSREDPIPGVHALNLVDTMRKRNPNLNVSYAPREELPCILEETLKPGDLFLTIGAGDGRQFGEGYVKEPQR